MSTATDMEATWPAPNYINPERKGNGLAIQVCILMALTIMALSTRVYSRVFFRRNFGIDDWLILPAMIAFIAVGILTILGTLKYDYGVHTWNVHISTRNHAMLVAWVVEILVTVCLTFTKLSLCTFYLRLLGGTSSRRSTIIIYTLMAIIVVWGIGYTVAIIFQCTPVRGVFIWDLPGRKCVERVSGIAMHAAFDVGTDVLIYALPIRKMWMLQVPLRQKILLVGLFMLGAFVITAGAMRLPASINSMKTLDTMWYIWTSVLWTTLECGLGILVACVPSMTPLFLRFVPGFAGTYASNNTPAREIPKLNAAHSYPMANLSTTVTGREMTETDSWNGSNENMISAGYDEGSRMERAITTITKTTVIEQTVFDERDGTVVKR